jgi:hypothetical protein
LQNSFLQGMLSRPERGRQADLALEILIDGFVCFGIPIQHDCSQDNIWPVCPIAVADIILGKDWLAETNPHIDWTTGVITIDDAPASRAIKPTPNAPPVAQGPYPDGEQTALARRRSHFGVYREFEHGQHDWRVPVRSAQR